MEAQQTGTLQIGDQWNAINILARSQTHPLKAVCELTENAIDARSSQIEISRYRRDGESWLEVQDNGGGIRLNEDGVPNFEYIATHICDSMKRHLEDRDGIHGEFGIGLLSFWNLGQELKMQSAGQDGRLHQMTLKRGGDGYTVKTIRGEMDMGGTRILIGPLLDATRSILTGEKLQRYLSAELANRIRNTGVEIRINDRIARKKFVVTPREFEGEPLELSESVETPFGPLLIDLYLRPSGSRDANVALCKDGTRVLHSITELVQFQGDPWQDDRLEGVIDYPPLNLAPGTRDGVVPDEYLEAFIESLHSVEEIVAEAVAQRDRAERERASAKILKQVHKVFHSALKALPAEEYYYFDIPGKRVRMRPVRDLTGEAGDAETQTAVAQKLDGELKLPLEPGPLFALSVTPESARKQVGKVVKLSARPCDRDGLALTEDVEFEWKIAGEGEISPDGSTCEVVSDVSGRVEVGVVAKQGARVAIGDAVIKFVSADSAEPNDTKKPLPTYRLEAERDSKRRSRYEAHINEIVVNSAHRDFLASTSSAKRHRQYIGKLYAKEVVLTNFAHESANDLMERLIEILVRTEASL